MATWGDLLNEFQSLQKNAKSGWLGRKVNDTLREISDLRRGSNVLLYGSAFLQKPHAPSPKIQIMKEDINGLMSTVHGMNYTKPLTLIIHTPGGDTNAAETIVEYLRSKFEYIETIVPTFAMSAGTMIALASNIIILGRQSQLGPIDPYIFYSNRLVSARAVVEQFDRAKDEILNDRDLAHVWAPILTSLGPSLISDAQNALDYGEKTVANWLKSYMYKEIGDIKERTEIAETAASHFNDATAHKSHGRRIDRDEARKVRINIGDLEKDQELQDAVLTLYHLLTILFEQSTTTKILHAYTGQIWTQHWLPIPEDS